MGWLVGARWFVEPQGEVATRSNHFLLLVHQSELLCEIISSTCAQRLFLAAINDLAQFGHNSVQFGSDRGNTNPHQGLPAEFK